MYKSKYKILKDIESGEIIEFPLIPGKAEKVGDITKIYNRYPFFNETTKLWDCNTVVKEYKIIKIPAAAKDFEFADVSGQ